MFSIFFCLMNENKLFRLFYFCIFSGSCAFAAAADSLAHSDSVQNLDKIVVTASRTKRLLSETPASASVITKSAIAASAARSIEDLLITQTGIQAKRSAGIGEGVPSDIIIRGIPGALASTRTLVLVDGIPTNASGTPFLIVNELPMDAIERIEIVRGPYSSLYGANAFGGVVNILTREGQGKFNGSVNSETGYPFTVLDQYFSENASMSNSLRKAGGLTLWSVNATGGAGNDKAGYLFSTGYRTIGNYLLRDYAIAQDGDSTYRISAANHGYTDFRLFGKSKYYPSENSELSLNLRYFNSDLGFGKTKNILPDSMNIVTKGDKILIGPQAKIIFSDRFTLHAGGFYRHVTGEFWNEGTDSSLTPVQTYWKSQTNDWQIESQGFLSLNTHNVVTAGVELLRNSARFGATVDPATGIAVPNSFPANKSIINGAGYIQDELKAFDCLNIVPVARLDYQTEFGSAFSPKLGVSYKPIDRLRLRASAGRSFRAPSLAELYLPDLQVNPYFLLKANPGLKPEYIWGFDGGVDIKANEGLGFTVGAFFNSMDNLITQMVVLGSTGNYITHRNVTAAWSKGIEAEINWLPLSWLKASGHGTVEDSKDNTYNVPLDYVPTYLFGCAATATFKAAAMNVEGQIGFNYVGKRSYLDFVNASLRSTPQGDWMLDVPQMPLSSYGTMDLSCKVTTVSKAWFAVAVQNLFNVVYNESPGTLAPGRFATMKIGLDF
jgi:outer membrane cobalamin receptor